MFDIPVIITVIAFSVYAINVVLHLLTCLGYFKKISTPTFALLMPLLAVAYSVTAPKINILILLAIIFGWLGDITKKPLPGAIPFGIGHILYCVAMIALINFDSLRAIHFIIPIILFIALMIILYRHLSPHFKQKSDKFVVLGYMFLISAMGVLSFVTLITAIAANTLSIGNILITLGGILFVCSDAILSETLFIPKVGARRFPVMSTYISAQTFIVIGFLLLNK